MIEIDLCERLGWTLDELDRQDMTRVLPVLIAANARDALQRCKRYVETHGEYKPSEADWRVWKWVNDEVGMIPDA